jgi:hypothetical protein
MKTIDLVPKTASQLPRTPAGTETIWHEFWKLGKSHENAPGIAARVTLTQPELQRV